MTDTMTSMIIATENTSTWGNAMTDHRPYPTGTVTPFVEDDGQVTGHYWETACTVAEICAVADYVDWVVRPSTGGNESDGVRVYVDRNLTGPMQGLSVELVKDRTCIGAAWITPDGEWVVTVSEPVDYVAVPPSTR